MDPDSGQFIWLTAQPGSKQLDSKAMETPGLEFQKRTTRYRHLNETLAPEWSRNDKISARSDRKRDQ